MKDLEFLIKKIIPEKYLLEKRLKRAIKKGYEKELTIIRKFSDKNKTTNLIQKRDFLSLQYSGPGQSTQGRDE